MEDLYKDIWNFRHQKEIKGRQDIKFDEWLKTFDEIIENCKTPIIDLGCGSGNDTLYLINKEKKVISLDYSEISIKKIKENIPEATAILHNIEKPLPFENNSSEIIISDLSLHYFSREITNKIIAEIKRVLMPSGYLLLRVNSVNDKNYGAGDGEEIEPHFYMVEDNEKMKMTKRFFDEADIREFFKDWKIEYINEETMGRYGNGKILWKVCLKNIK